MVSSCSSRLTANQKHAFCIQKSCKYISCKCGAMCVHLHDYETCKIEIMWMCGCESFIYFTPRISSLPPSETGATRALWTRLLGERPVCSVPESEMVPSSPASSPAVCIYWTKSWPRLQAGTPDIIPTRQLFSPTCHSAVSQHIRTCWRSLSEADGFCLLCLSSGVLVMDQR